MISFTSSPEILQRSDQIVSSVNLSLGVQRRSTESISRAIILSGLPRQIIGWNVESIGASTTWRSALERGGAGRGRSRGGATRWGRGTSVSVSTASKEAEGVEKLTAGHGQSQSNQNESSHLKIQVQSWFWIRVSRIWKNSSAYDPRNVKMARFWKLFKTFFHVLKTLDWASIASLALLSKFLKIYRGIGCGSFGCKCTTEVVDSSEWRRCVNVTQNASPCPWKTDPTYFKIPLSLNNWVLPSCCHLGLGHKKE